MSNNQRVSEKSVNLMLLRQRFASIADAREQSRNIAEKYGVISHPIFKTERGQLIVGLAMSDY